MKQAMVLLLVLTATGCIELPIRRVLGDLLACRQPYTGLTRRLLTAAVAATSRTRSPSAP